MTWSMHAAIMPDANPVTSIAADQLGSIRGSLLSAHADDCRAYGQTLASVPLWPAACRRLVLCGFVVRADGTNAEEKVLCVLDAGSTTAFPPRPSHRRVAPPRPGERRVHHCWGCG